jgi:hydroxyacyl-ACP dehydratase HTD2-like protein with hotdog domain
MSLTLRRLYSSVSSTPSATSIASQFLTKTQTLPPLKQTQFLDANQLQRFSATLSRAELAALLPAHGTLLPPCYHLAYFTPAQPEELLGRDGTDTTFNPPRPFTRRMWAGGELEWCDDAERGLSVGQEVVETTRLLSAVGKKTRAGEEMVVVGVEKTFENEHGVALVDKRYVCMYVGDWKSPALAFIFFADTLDLRRLGIGSSALRSRPRRRQRPSRSRYRCPKASTCGISCRRP